jgi:hypothetical protein
MGYLCLTYALFFYPLYLLPLTPYQSLTTALFAGSGIIWNLEIWNLDRDVSSTHFQQFVQPQLHEMGPRRYRQYHPEGF